MARVKGIALTKTVEESVPRVMMGDPGRIRQVLSNLLSNAVKFTEEGFISIAVTRAAADGENRIRIEVKDTGVGIPENRHSDLFKEFTSLDVSQSRKEGGTGLGLAISRTLTQLMGGEIGVQSRVGEGATFWIELPLEEAPEQDIGGQTEDVDPTQEAQTPSRILMVEDNATNAMIAKTILEKSGHRVDTAADGREAVDAVTQFPYDLVFMDVTMPEMDGLEATRRIRLMEGETSKIPIIALTALAMKGDRERVLEAGMDDYVQKPVSADTLLDTVAEWCGGKESGFDPKSLEKKDNHAADILDTSALEQLAKDTSKEAIPKFIVSFRKTLTEREASIRQAIESKDFETLERDTHTIGSSCATFGAMQCHHLSRACEHACADENFDEAVEIAAQVLESIEETQDALATFAANYS